MEKKYILILLFSILPVVQLDSKQFKSKPIRYKKVKSVNSKFVKGDSSVVMPEEPNSDEFYDSIDYDIPRPVLNENPSAFKIWFRRIGIYIFYKMLDAKLWVQKKYRDIIK